MSDRAKTFWLFLVYAGGLHVAVVAFDHPGLLGTVTVVMYFLLWFVGTPLVAYGWRRHLQKRTREPERAGYVTAASVAVLLSCVLALIGWLASVTMSWEDVVEEITIGMFGLTALIYTLMWLGASGAVWGGVYLAQRQAKGGAGLLDHAGRGA